MLAELVIRFLLGGAIVSTFAVAGDLLKPKSFAGIFGAAPSVALATLSLAYAKHGDDYAAVEARSMVLGAVALLLYSASSARIVRERALPPWAGTAILWIQWIAIALALRLMVLS